MKNDDLEFEYDIDKDKEFNPIKEQVGGKAAERVVWSTYSLNTAVKALQQGLPLKANPFIGKNTKLLRADLVYRRTEEEIEDYIHCKEDPLYFASKCFLMTPEGLQACVLRDYQEDYLRHLQKNRFSIFLSCRQSGKSLNLLSNIIVKFNKKILNNCQQVKKINFYYIKDDIYYLPIFELYNLYCKQTLIWKCKYQLYKIIYKLTYGRKKGQKITKKHEDSPRFAEYYKKQNPELPIEQCEENAKWFKKSCNYQCIEYYEKNYPELSHEEHLELKKKLQLQKKQNKDTNIEYWKKRYPKKL